MAVQDNSIGATLNASGLDMKTKKVINVGAATASTDAASLANTLDQFAAPAANVAMNSKKLTGLAAGTAAGNSVRYEQVALLDGSQAFTAVEGGVDATAITHLATLNNANQGTIPIQAVTAASLPAYTASGSGSTFTITANANGAFPTLDVNATVTASASEAISSRFLLHHGAATTDNRVFSLTTQGDAGTPWAAKVYSGLATSAAVLGSKLRVLSGEQSGGGEYVHLYENTFTLGTTPMYYHRVDPMMGSNEGTRFKDSCAVNATASNGVALANNLTLAAIGTGSIISQTFPTSGAHGEYSWQMGTTATGTGFIYGPANVAFANSTDIDVSIRFMSTTLSTVSQEYALNIGLSKENANNQHTPTNGACVVYDRVNKGNNLFIITVSGGTSTSTYVDTGLTYTANRRYRLRITKRAGEDIIRYTLKDDAGGSFTTSHSSNIPNGNEMFCGALGFRITGTTNVTGAMVVDWVDPDIQYPTRVTA